MPSLEECSKLARGWEAKRPPKKYRPWMKGVANVGKGIYEIDSYQKPITVEEQPHVQVLFDLTADETQVDAASTALSLNSTDRGYIAELRKYLAEAPDAEERSAIMDAIQEIVTFVISPNPPRPMKVPKRTPDEIWQQVLTYWHDGHRAACLKISVDLLKEKPANPAEFARATEPEGGWGGRSVIGDIWVDGFRVACVEISDDITRFTKFDV